MRQFLILFIVGLLINCSVPSPDKPSAKEEFEGVIVFRITADSKTPNISSAELQKMYGDTMIMYIKDGNYRMTYNGLDIKEDYYLTDGNKEYILRRNIDTLDVYPCDLEERPIISSILHEEEEIILNRRCKRITNDLGTVKNSYWFDPALYTNPIYFKDRKFSHINLYYEKAKSPWLRYKYEGEAINLDYVAIKLQAQKISDSLFQLPPLPRREY